MSKTIYERRVQTESISEQKIDTSIFKKRGKSKTFHGFLIQKIKEARNQGNKEMVFLLHEIYKKYRDFNIDFFNPRRWRGKSGVSFIEKPEVVISIRHRKIEPYEEPEEVRMELLRTDINRLIWVVSTLNQGQYLKTSEIAEKYYDRGWKLVFSDRKAHIYLVEMLNYIEYRKVIEYSRSGRIKMLTPTLQGGNPS